MYLRKNTNGEIEELEVIDLVISDLNEIFESEIKQMTETMWNKVSN